MSKQKKTTNWVISLLLLAMVGWAVAQTVTPVSSAVGQDAPSADNAATPAANAPLASAPAETSSVAPVAIPSLSPVPAPTNPAPNAANPNALIPQMSNAVMPAAMPNAAGSEELAALTQKEQALLDELAALKPTDENYSVRLQSIGAELRDIQSKTQELQFRASGGMTPNGMMPAGAMPNGLESFGPMLGGANFSAPVAGSFDPMNDPALLKQIKEELTFQLKQLQQTLTTLGPQDAALSTALKEQETDLLKQLTDINAKLGASAQGATESSPNALDPNAPLLPTDPNANAGMNADMINTGDVADRIAKVSQAAILLREAGLVELANHALNQAGSLSDPNFVEAPISATQQAPSGAEWFAPGQAAQSQDIAELKETSAAMKAQIDQMVSDLKNIDAQLKLLSRQAVAAPAPPAAPAETEN